MTISNDLRLGPVDDVGGQTLFEQVETVHALIDTGATSSALDQSLCISMRLESLGTKEFLCAGAEHTQILTYYGGTLLLHADFSSEQKHEFPDIVQFAGMSMGDRPYRAIIGMDVLTGGVLKLENGARAISFEF